MLDKKEVVIKSYEMWPGTQRFFFEGKLMVGAKYRNLLATVVLLNVPNFLNFIFAIQTESVSVLCLPNLL